MRTINKSLKNGEIYSYAVELLNNFVDPTTYLPAAVIFCIEKNKKLLLELANEIEVMRVEILQHYQMIKTEEGFQISPEEVDQANKEIKDLLDIVTEVKLYVFNIEELKDLEFTPSQMEAILFMIDEE